MLTSAPVLTMATAVVAAAAFEAAALEAAARRWRCGQPGAAQEPEAEGTGSRAAANGGVRARGGAGAGVEIGGARFRGGEGPASRCRRQRSDGASARRRGGGAEAEWRPTAATAAKSIWAEARIEGEGQRPGLCYIYGATLVPGQGIARY